MSNSELNPCITNVTIVVIPLGGNTTELEVNFLQDGILSRLIVSDTCRTSLNRMLCLKELILNTRAQTEAKPDLRTAPDYNPKQEGL